jgi:hypothetical protein
MATPQLVALCWMLVGFVVYFLYGRGHSKLNAQEAELQNVASQPS